MVCSFFRLSFVAVLLCALSLATAPGLVNATHGIHKARAAAGSCEGKPAQQVQKLVYVAASTPVATNTLSLGRQPLREAATTRRASTTKTTSTRKATTTSTKKTTTKPKTTSTKSSSTKAPASTGSSGSAPAGFGAAILKAHNEARSTHGAKALTWSSKAEAAAKAWAEKCVWHHGGASGMGQNLAASAGYKQTGQQIVSAWMSEEKDYNPSKPNYSHFTQVVWKSTTQVGCYQATCKKLLNENGSETFPGFSPSYFVSNLVTLVTTRSVATTLKSGCLTAAQKTVCNYTPAGNVQGQFPANVQKKKA